MSLCLQQHWQDYTDCAGFFFFFNHGWRWNKEHIAGGGPPEQKKRENAKKKHASFSDLLGRSVCVRLCVSCSFCNPPHFAKKCPTTTGRIPSRPHTSPAMAFVVWVYEDFWGIFFPPTIELLSVGRNAHESAVWLWSNQDFKHLHFIL